MDDIIKNNKLIAEFMGGIYKSNMFDIPNDSVWLPYHNLERVINLKYHSSWDWLMSVVEKIDDMDIVIHFNIYKSSVDLTYWKIDDIGRISFINESKFIMIYKAVVEFIKWYNKIKQN